MLPILLGQYPGKVLKGVGKLRFGGAPSGVQTPSEAGYPSTFYEGFGSMTLFGPLSGVFFWEHCLELRIGYFMGQAALLHWFALVSMSLHSAALVCIDLRSAASICTVA